MSREKGEEYPVKYLEMWLIILNKMVGVDNQMNELQVNYTSQLIFEEIPQLTIADIKLVFDRIISGYYGEFYNLINSVKICRWFREYWEERLEVGATRSQMEHDKRKSREQGGERITGKEVQKIKDAVKKFKDTR